MKESWEFKEAYKKLVNTKPFYDNLEVAEDLFKKRAQLIVKMFGEEGLTEKEEKLLDEIRLALDEAMSIDSLQRFDIVHNLLEEAVKTIEKQEKKYYTLLISFNKKLKRKLYRDKLREQ